MSFQLAPLGAVAKTRRVDLAHWRRRTLPAERVGTRTTALQVFPVLEEVFPLPRVPKRHLPPAGASGWQLPHDALRGARGAAAGGERKIPPSATPAPAGHSGDRRRTPPRPPPGGRGRTLLMNFLNPSPSLTPRVVGPGNE